MNTKNINKKAATIGGIGGSLIVGGAVAAYVLATLAGTGSVSKFDSGMAATTVVTSGQQFVDPAGIADLTLPDVGWDVSLDNVYGEDGTVRAELSYLFQNQGSTALLVGPITATAGPGLQVTYVAGACTMVAPGDVGSVAVVVSVEDAAAVDGTGWELDVNFQEGSADCSIPAAGTVL